MVPLFGGHPVVTHVSIQLPFPLTQVTNFALVTPGEGLRNTYHHYQMRFNTPKILNFQNKTTIISNGLKKDNINLKIILAYASYIWMTRDKTQSTGVEDKLIRLRNECQPLLMPTNNHLG